MFRMAFGNAETKVRLNSRMNPARQTRSTLRRRSSPTIAASKASRDG